MMFKLMKRIRKTKWVTGMMVLSASTLMADVTLDFNYSGINLNGLQPLTLAFSVDGAGNVSLDASTGNGTASFVSAVDAWDGAVGTITESSLFGITFTLTSQSFGDGIVLNEIDTGVLGISGRAAARIDDDATETLRFEASGLGPDIALDFKTVSYGNRAANGASNVKLMDADTSTVYVIPLPTSGTLDLAGEQFAIQNGEGLSFTTDSTGVVGAGYGLAGFTFDAVVIPEPTTMSLLGVVGLGILLRRRLAR